MEFLEALNLIFPLQFTLFQTTCALGLGDQLLMLRVYTMETQNLDAPSLAILYDSKVFVYLLICWMGKALNAQNDVR